MTKGIFETRSKLEAYIREKFFIDGLIMADIAKKVNVGHSTVSQILSETTVIQRKILQNQLIKSL